MSLRVETVTDKRSWSDFLRLPYAIYRDDPNWVPPLDAEVRRTLDASVNPYFHNARLGVFIAYRNNEPVSRACVVVNQAHFDRFQSKAACFGFYESIDDSEATGRLFETVSQFCREAGADSIEGPFNPNHYSELGLQVSGFDLPQVFFETHNPAYYTGLLEANGLHILRRLHTRSNSNAGAYIRQRYGNVKRPRALGEFSVRPFRLLSMKQELELIRSVYNDAFADNWQFLPVSAAEYAFAAKYLFFVTYPRFVAIVEHRGDPVAVAQCALDVNPLLRQFNGSGGLGSYGRFLIGRGNLRDVVIVAIGIKRAFQGTDAFRLLHEYLCWVLRDCQAMTTTWMTDDNIPALSAARLFGLESSKYFAIYGKQL